MNANERQAAVTVDALQAEGYRAEPDDGEWVVMAPGGERAVSRGESADQAWRMAATKETLRRERLTVTARQADRMTEVLDGMAPGDEG